MKQSQLNDATTLLEEVRKLKGELRKWKDDITSPKHLAYMLPYDSSGRRGAVALYSNMSQGLFDSFRQSIMNELKLLIQEKEAEFAAM